MYSAPAPAPAQTSVETVDVSGPSTWTKWLLIGGMVWTVKLTAGAYMFHRYRARRRRLREA